MLPGVDVTLTSVGTGLERRAVTNESGLYTFPNVPVGEYKITAALTGFRPVTQTGVALTAGVNIRVDVQLALGTVSETIQVVAATTLVDTSVIGRTLRAEEIAETPLSGRRASQVAQLAPGVVGGNMGGSVPTGVGTFATGITSINGGRSDEFITTIDGAPSIRVRAAGGFMMGAQNFDTVAEVQVLTTNYQAEFGRASAGQLRLVTKSGTQNFRGNMFWSHQNDALDTNTWTREQAGLAKSPHTYNAYGFTLGGPIYIPGQVQHAASRSCSSSGARSGSAIAPLKSRPPSCRPPRCATATSARSCPDAYSRSADRTAVPGQHHPAGPDQPAGQGAGQRVAAADSGIPAGREQLDREPGGLQQPAEGQHQDRRRAVAEASSRHPAYVGAERLERSGTDDGVLDDLGLSGPHAGGDADEHADQLADERVLVLVGIDQPVEILRTAQLRLLSGRRRRAAVSRGSPTSGSTIRTCSRARSSIRTRSRTSRCRDSPPSTTPPTRDPGTTSCSSGPTTSRKSPATTRSRPA